jgi:hypothetical protein
MTNFRSQQYEQEETLDDDSDEAYARRLQQQEGGWAAGTYGETSAWGMAFHGG